MNILITGFEPFGDEKINPSWEAVKALKDRIQNAEVFTLELPTEFDRAAEIVIYEADKHDADVVISIGQAGGRAAVSVELIGINYKHSTMADNAGIIPTEEKIKEDGDDGYFTNLPVIEMVNNIKSYGIPAYVSYSAGTYVCNDLLYSLLYDIKKRNLKRKAGFIHVPYIHEQVLRKNINTPSISLERLIEALHIAIETIIKRGWEVWI